jgi:hypothetical protein
MADLENGLREPLAHDLLFDERHLDRVSHEFAAYFNSARPHQGLHQGIPDAPVTASSTGPIVVRPSSVASAILSQGRVIAPVPSGERK